MKHFLYILVLLIWVAPSVMAQPETTWLERTHDFGVFLERDGKVTCAMRVVNTGNEPLMIIKAQAGCGCTAIDYPESPIQPGDTASVSITYNPSRRPGEFTKQAIIFTNTTARRTILEISGNVIPTEATLDERYPLRAGALRISQQIIPMGELSRGKNKTEFLSAYNASTDTLIVTVAGDKPHLSPAIVPDTVPPARVTALTVHYHSDNAPLWGLNTDTLTMSARPIHDTPAANSGSADVLVTAQVIEDFSRLSDQERRDAPVLNVDCGDRLDFGTLTSGQTASRSFTITNRGKDKLCIRRLWVPEGEGISVQSSKSEVKRGKSVTVTVTVDTSLIQGELLNVPLTLLCNDPDSSRVTIKLVGIIDKE